MKTAEDILETALRQAQRHKAPDDLQRRLWERLARLRESQIHKVDTVKPETKHTHGSTGK